MALADNTLDAKGFAPGFSDTDRLGLTAFGSVIAHLVLILGVGFAMPQFNREAKPLPTLEITLVNTLSDTQPEDADFLAQTNQEGGGDSARNVNARSPLPVLPTPQTSRQLPVARLLPEPGPRTRETTLKPMTQEQQERLTMNTKPPEPLTKVPHQDKSKAGLVEKPMPVQERARLSAEISRFWEEYQKRPRRKFLSARTKEYRYAAYMEAWRAKVERVGNLNYPEQARRRKLTGDLVLDVEIRQDGEIHAVNVVRPSGHKILDDAAIRIVRLAAPYDPFPDHIRKEVDILHITRTWQFLRGNRLVSK